jgi:hypothetical protein
MRFGGGCARKSRILWQEMHIVRYMRNLQQPYFLRLYGKLLSVPRLGTQFSWLERGLFLPTVTVGPVLPSTNRIGESRR